MSGKATWGMLAALAGGLGWMVLGGPRETVGGQQEASAPDDHGASLIAVCREALDRCDADAFLALIYTGNAPEAQDLATNRKVFEMDCGRPIDSIAIEPLESTDSTSYELRGVRYRPTRPPEGKLVIRFASAPDAAVHDETTSMLVGRAQGRWRILTAEPDR